MATEYHGPYLCELINYFIPNGGIGVEIGVNQGATSRLIMESTKISKLFMVDPWMKNFDTTRGLYTTKGNPESDYKEVNRFFKNTFPDRSEIVRKTSIDASNDIQNELDFVFIDANHNYESVMQDLIAWVPKVRSGGLVAGHDWWGKFPDVAKAVIEFCQKYDPFRPPIKPVDLPNHFIPAPGSGTPVVMKSWPLGHLWWAINK